MHPRLETGVATLVVAARAWPFVWYPNVKRLQPLVLLLDAAGLGLFAAAGTQLPPARPPSPRKPEGR